jgi:hypothetical protein
MPTKSIKVTTYWSHGFVNEYVLEHPNASTVEHEIARLSKFTSVDYFILEDQTGKVLHNSKETN